MASPEHYVLKPQREGGGHNFYGALAELLGKNGASMVGKLTKSQQQMLDDDGLW